MSDEQREKVAVVVADVLKKSTSEVLASATLEELGYDSLYCVDVVMALEEEFGVSINDSEADKVKTLDELVQLVETSAPSH